MHELLKQIYSGTGRRTFDELGLAARLRGKSVYLTALSFGWAVSAIDKAMLENKEWRCYNKGPQSRHDRFSIIIVKYR